MNKVIDVEINKLLTKINFTKGKNRKIEYIVIHYVGAEGGAKANCRYFERFYRGASAHYFVGHEGEIWQCVEDADIAWHCGAKKYIHPKARNANSIGIEMCCRKGDKWYFEPETVAATIGLVKELRKKYNIPITNVIRHYDVTGKHCPEPYVRNNTDWILFKAQLATVDKKPVETEDKFVDYLVEITASVLNVRKGPGTNYGIATTVKKGQVYTIVGEQNGWGKLKSGAGWISLKYTKRRQS